MEPDPDAWLEADYEDRQAPTSSAVSLESYNVLYDLSTYDIDPEESDIDNWTGEPTL